MTDIEINLQFKKALDLIKNGEQKIFITGKAGTGKSTFLTYFKKESKEKPVIIAPTGVAALNVKGQTIHSFFNFPIDVTEEKISQKEIKPSNKTIYKNLKILVIDEISMVRADLLDCINTFLKMYGPKKKSFGGVQIIFVGDLYQLPPIVSKEEKKLFESLYETPYFYSAKCLKDSNFEIIELEKVYRQKDIEFVELLNKIRNNSVEENDLKYLNKRFEQKAEENKFYINLTTTNSKSDEINNEHLLELKEKLHTSEGIINGNFSKEYLPTAVFLQFKVGSQIMLLTNDVKRQWVNGSIGVIENIDTDIENEQFIEVLLKNNKLVKIYQHTWEVYKFSLKDNKIVSDPIGTFKQFPFRLAWAITIHKSQGKTFDNVILDIGKGTFAPGQTYVALSRCTSLDGLILKNIIKKSHIRTDFRVSKFLTGYQYDKVSKIFSIEEKFELVKKAIQNESKLKMTYLKINDTKTYRTVIPKIIREEKYKGKTFPGMHAICLERKEERIFHVGRILELEEI